MSIQSRLAGLPPRQIFLLHAQRLTSVGPMNWWQRRRMIHDENAAVVAVAHTLTSNQPAELSTKISAVEGHRSYLTSAGAAQKYSISVARATSLAMVGSKTPRWAGLIARIVTALRPVRVLELGTAVGISGAYIGTALATNGHGKLTTIEANRSNHSIATDTFATLSLASRVDAIHGTFENTLDDLLKSQPLFDLAFKDGDHTEAATVERFKEMVPQLAPTAAFLFDDIRRDAGMKRAWDKIIQHENVDASIDFYGMGLVFLAPKPNQPSRHFRYGIR